MATDPWTFASAIEREILDYLSSSCESLADLGIEIFRGITTGRDQVFVIDEQIKQQLIETYHDSGLIIHPTYSGKHISPYRLSWNGLYIIFTQRNIDINRFPGIKQYLEQFEEILAPKPKSVKISHPWKGRKSGNYQWYEIQDTTAYAGYFSMPKIVATKAASIPSFTIDYLEGYPRNTVYIFNNASKSLLAQLNSTVAQFYIQRQFAKLGTNTEPKVYELLSLPVNQLPPVLKGVLDAISNYLLLLYHLQDTEVYELIVLFSRLQNLLVLELYFMELLFEEGIYLKKGFKWMIITKEYLDFVEVDNVIKDLQFNVNQSTRELKVRSIVDTIMKVGESIKSKQLCEKIHHDLSQHRYIAYILQYDKI